MGVGIVTLRVAANSVIRTVLACNGRTNDSAVPDLEIAYILADVIDHSNPLVTEHRARLEPLHRAANGTCRQSDDRITRLFELRIRHLF